MSCDNKIIKLYVPNGHLLNGGNRVPTIRIKLGGLGCCKESNVVTIGIPPVPPMVPPPVPEKCLDKGIDLIGHIVRVSYDRAKCGGIAHGCNNAIFHLYINNTFIGQANLNNANDGKYRETLFTIQNSIIANPGLVLELRCALPTCHSGIGRIEIMDPVSKNIVYANCIPNDVIITDKILCP